FSNYVFIESTGIVTKTSANINSLKDLAGKTIAVIVGTTNERALVASDKLLLVGTQFKDVQSLRMLPDDISIEPYAIVLPRGDWALRLAVNTGLAQIYRDGRVVGVFKAWFDRIGLQMS